MAVCNCSLLEYNHGRTPTAGKDGRLESIARLNTNSLMAGCRGQSVTEILTYNEPRNWDL